ncbi:hypothetical protein HYV88_05630 [Candidatus Woesearchaeota archaeon]|nr:hypothetical protein [Candidatus Woesearchaeota archaeon]
MKIKFILISAILLILVLLFVNFFILDYSKVKITGKATGPCIVDNVCDASIGEDSVNCPEDCGTGGTGGGSGGGSVGIIEDIPLGKGISNSTTFGFDWSFVDVDIPILKDTQINFQNRVYDIHEELVLSKYSPSLETSLTSQDDDYASNVFLETMSKDIQFYYVFDDLINVSKATTNEPLIINFLGKDIKIISVGDSTRNLGNKFTALVGGEYFMNVGESIDSKGKTLALQNVGEGGSVLVSVGGVQGSIPAKTELIVNGLAIYNFETYYTNELSERSAVLYVGDDAIATYQDGDAFIGENENDPDWEWVIHGLAESATTTVNVIQAEFPSSYPAGPVIGIKNAFTKDDDTDFPPGIGSCYNLPNDYISICLDSLTVPDNDYLEVTTKYNPSVDTAKSGHPEGRTSAKVIEITAPGENRFNLGGHLTSQIWLQVFTNGEIGIFYKDPNQNPSVQFFNNFDFSSKTPIGDIEFMDTSGNNGVFWGGYSGSYFNLYVEMTGDSSVELKTGEDSLVSKWLISDGEFLSLGNIISLAEPDELVWNTLYESFSSINNLGIKNEDHRTKYGVIIKNPALNGASDQVILLIPSDQVQGNVKIKGATCVDSDGGKNYYTKGTLCAGTDCSEDSCVTDLGVNSGDLREWSCLSDGSISIDLYECESEGKICSSGACVSLTPCTNGCSLNNICLPVGYRNLAEQGASYCSGVLWAPQKANNEACQNNFECLSNFCSNNKCVDLVSDIQSNTGILNQILTFLQSK